MQNERANNKNYIQTNEDNVKEEMSATPSGDQWRKENFIYDLKKNRVMFKLVSCKYYNVEHSFEIYFFIMISM